MSNMMRFKKFKEVLKEANSQGHNIYNWLIVNSILRFIQFQTLVLIYISNLSFLIKPIIISRLSHIFNMLRWHKSFPIILRCLALIASWSQGLCWDMFFQSLIAVPFIFIPYAIHPCVLSAAKLRLIWLNFLNVRQYALLVLRYEAGHYFQSYILCAWPEQLF